MRESAFSLLKFRDLYKTHALEHFLVARFWSGLDIWPSLADASGHALGVSGSTGVGGAMPTFLYCKSGSDVVGRLRPPTSPRFPGHAAHSPEKSDSRD